MKNLFDNTPLVVALLALLAALSVVGVSKFVNAHKVASGPTSARFTEESLPGPQVSLIHDLQTGKTYLTRYGGGFTEVEPTKKP